MPLLRPVDRSNNGCCAKKAIECDQNRFWIMHMQRGYFFSVPLGSLQSTRLTPGLKGLIKMNGHTQGGGVQLVQEIQFCVLLPSGCQGQVLSWGYDARPRRVGTVSRLASKHNLFSIQIQNNSQQQKTKATMFPLQGCKIKEIQHQHTTKEARIYKRKS